MPRPLSRTDNDLKAHQEWLGYLQPVGLVVAPAAMVEAGWVVEQGGRELVERQELFREGLQPLVLARFPVAEAWNGSGGRAGTGPDATGEATEESEGPIDADPDTPRGFPSLEALLVDQLHWEASAIQRNPERLLQWTRELHELGETLRPTAVVPGFEADGTPQLLIQELRPTAEGLPVELDRRQAGGDQGWRATPQERFERLLRECGVEQGLL
ncbi:MAG: hypothetical protein ACKOPS_08180, partial [Cyanobium sp.]